MTCLHSSVHALPVLVHEVSQSTPHHFSVPLYKLECEVGDFQKVRNVSVVFFFCQLLLNEVNIELCLVFIPVLCCSHFLSGFDSALFLWGKIFTATVETAGPREGSYSDSAMASKVWRGT